MTAADCATLGNDYRCDLGACRKGTAACPAVALPPGGQAREIVVSGTTRSYLLHVPPGYSGNVQVPLALDFHPMGLGLDWAQANSGYKSLSDQEGFITVWPQGLENTWNIGPCCTTSKTVDDDAFARAIVKQLSVEACLDPRRVYATGFSMGGAMAYYYLACRQAGDADTIVPYAGGSTSPPGHPEMAFDVLGAVGTFEKWASLAQCIGLPNAANINGCSTYSKCQGGEEVALCTTPGGGQVVGDAKTAWAMLEKHPMPQVLAAARVRQAHAPSVHAQPHGRHHQLAGAWLPIPPQVSRLLATADQLDSKT